jgi:hypothetical protein
MMRTYKSREPQYDSVNLRVLELAALCFVVDDVSGGLSAGFKQNFFALFHHTCDLPKWAKKKGLRLMPNIYIANAKAYKKNTTTKSIQVALLCCFMTSEQDS